MRKQLFITFLSIIALVPEMIYGQNVHSEFQKQKRKEIEDYRNKKRAEMNNYRDKKRTEMDSFRMKKWQEFQEYRKRKNRELMSYMSEKWIEIPTEKPIPAPKRPDPVVPPTVSQKDDQKGKTIEIPHGNVVKSTKPQQTKPQSPVPPLPEEIKQPQLSRQAINLFGTSCNVAINENFKLLLPDISEKSVVKMWEEFEKGHFSQITIDCFNLKEQMRLNGWCMLNLCKKIADKIEGQDTNESAVLLSYLMNEQGYDVQLCRINDNKLVPIFTSSVELCQIPKMQVGGKIYHLFGVNDEFSKVHLFEKMKYFTEVEPINFDHAMYISFSSSQSSPQTFTSTFNEKMTTTVRSNKSLIQYYNSLPLINDWSFYARQPMFPSTKAQIIPALKRTVAGKNEIDAANDIIHFVQSAFTYKADSIQFGRERIFYKEELFYYSGSDCEDRSVLFSDLIHEILGLDVVLLYYPWHMATAVKFNTPFNGHYIMVDKQKYMICDPTCRYSEVGFCHSDYRNEVPQIYRIYE